MQKMQTLCSPSNKAYNQDIWLCSKCEALSVPPPTPSPPPPSAINNIKILQFNINGICGKLTELLHYLNFNNIMIAALQESKLTDAAYVTDTGSYTL